MSIFTEETSRLKNADKTWSYSESAGNELRFEVRGGDYYDNPLTPPSLDDEAQGKNRSEITSVKKTQAGRQFTIEYDFLVEDGADNDADWLLLTQLRQTEDTNPDGSLKDSGTASPPFAVQMRGERLEIVGRTDPNEITVDTPERIAAPGMSTLYLDNTALPRNTWINLRIEIVFDSDPNGDGALRVWRDNVQIVNYDGPIGYNDVIGPYLQMGVYRAATPEAFAVRYRDVTYEAEGPPPTIDGTSGDDNLNANLVGFYEDETLNAGAGDDTLDGGFGADTMNGGSGNDEYFVNDAGDVVNERSGGVDQGGIDVIKTSVTRTLGTDIENLLMLDDGDIDATGNAKDNNISGNGGDNTLNGAAGDDSVLGGGGDDSVEGGSGNDRVYGDTGQDTVHGGLGNDEVYGDDGNDSLFGDDGNDSLYGGAGTDTMTGGTGNDVYIVEQASDVVVEQEAQGEDTVRAGVSYDAGASNSIEVLSTIDIAQSDAINLTGTDAANEIRGNAGSNVLAGRGGDDLILGYGGADTLNGGAGSDTLDGGGGVDSMAGGAGDDQYLVTDIGDTVTEAAGQGSDTVRATADFDAGAGNEIEVINAFDTSSLLALDLSGSDTDNEIRGTAGANRLIGRGGDDLIQAYAGSDTVDGGAGDDTLIGGDGNDSVMGGSGADNINGDGGNDTIDGGADGDKLYGGNGADSITGGDGDDTLFGGDGADTLDGGAGADVLYGEASDQTGNGGLMRGGAGDDVFYVTAANTTIVEMTGGGTDMVRTTVSVALQDGSDVEAIRVDSLTTTNDLDLSGSAIANELRGNAGDNLLDGRGGADTMFGYAGDDIYVVDNAGDRVNEWAGNGFDILRTSVDFSLGSTQYIERLEVVGSAGRTLRANDLDNVVIGGIGNDSIRGQGGDDTLSGGAGNDTLYGGDGIDRVVLDVSSTTVTATRGGSSMRLASTEGEDIILDDVEFVVFSDQTLTYLAASELVATEGGVNIVSGDNTTQTLSGTGGNDSISAMDGFDWILPGHGSDTIDGGAGKDMVSYSDLSEVAGRGPSFMVNLDLGAGTAKLFGGAQDVLRDVERATGSIFTDVMRGSDGNDELRGLGDYDWFVATEGNDTLDGGNGLDMITFVEWAGTGAASVLTVFSDDGAPPSGSAVAGVTLDLSNPSASTGLAQGLTLLSVERITGSSYQDVFYGDENENDFRGLGGYDWFVGSTGGRERYFGGDGLDTVTYYSSGAGVIASLRNGAGLSGGQETGYGSGGDAVRDLYFEIENLVGSGFGDRLEGNSERNQLAGLGGDDYLLGYGGIDYLKGGAGNDTLDGGAGSDYAIFDGDRSEYTLTRTSATEVTIIGSDGTDSLIGIEYFQFDDETGNIWELVIA